MSNGTSAVNLDFSSISVSDIDRTIKFLQEIKKKLLAVKPVKYGSDEWWEKSDAKAMEEYRKGNYVTITNKKELKEFLGV